MILTYHPDTDTLDVDFDIPHQGEYETLQEARESKRKRSEMVSTYREEEVDTHDAEPSGQTLAHYLNEELRGLTIEHASRRAPAAWKIEALRQEAAQVAASTGRIVESVTYNLVRNLKSIHTGRLGPHSPHTSDQAVREYNELIDHYREKTTAA
jgi:hypothetical protein